MNAREYLESFIQSEKKIELKINQVQKLQESLTMLSAPMDKEQVSHSRNVSVMAETVAQIVDMEKEIDQQTAELFNRKRKVFLLLDQISSDSASLLTEHYLNAIPLSEISKARFVSIRHIQRKLNRALDEFQPILDQAKDVA